MPVATELLQIESEATLLVSPSDQRPKTCLKAAATGLLEAIAESRLARGAHTVPGDARARFIGLFNLGSLLLYHYGRVDHAKTIMQRLIALCQEIAREPGCEDWAISAIQSYINVARLEGINGNCAESIRMLENVVRCAAGLEDLVCDGFHIHPGQLVAGSSAEGGIQDVAQRVYLFDGVKAHLQSRDYAGLLAFLARAEMLRPHLGSNWSEHIALEARARALAGLGYYNEALAVIRSLLQLILQTDRHIPTVHTLAGAIYWRAGRTADSAKVVEFSEKYVGRVYGPDSNPLARFNTFLLVSLMQARLEEYEKAHQNARIALEAARRVGHQTGVLRALAILVELDSAPGRDPGDGWDSDLQALLEACYYNADRAIGLCAGAETGAAPDRHDRLIGASAVFAMVNTASTRQFRAWLLERALIPDRISPEPNRAFQSAPSLNEIFERLMTLQVDVALPSGGSGAVHAEAGFK